MILLKVDESFVFDFISILEVKIEFLENHNFIKTYYDEIVKHLYDQIGENKTNLILNSTEYKSLKEKNKEIYLTIEKIRSESCISDGKIVDNLNLDRFKCKQIIQNCYFDKSVSEIKTQV